MADEVKISNLTHGEQISTVRNAFNKVDDDIRMMFQELDEKVQEVHEIDDSQLDVKFDKLIAIEYLIVRVRSRVMRELTNVQHALSKSGGTSFDRVFKDRYNTVVMFCQRLNEFRDDIALVQRSMYSRTFGR